MDAGLFTFVGSEFEPATRCVGLIDFAGRYGRSGFVRHVEGTSGADRVGPFRNLNFDVNVGGGWWYQDED